MKSQTASATCLKVALPMAVALALAACSSPSSPTGTTVTSHGAARPAGSWPYPNGNLANTRVAAGSAITSANVSRLQRAWTSVGHFFTGISAAGLTGLLAALTVVLLAAGFATARRVTV